MRYLLVAAMMLFCVSVASAETLKANAFVCADKADLKLLVKYAAVDDKRAMIYLLADGKCILSLEERRAMVTMAGFSMMRVRIQWGDGYYEGWTVSEAVE